MNNYAWLLLSVPLRRCNAKFVINQGACQNLMPRLNCMDMQPNTPKAPRNCISLGYNPPGTSKPPSLGLPWLTRKQEMSVAASAVCPRLSVGVLGRTPGNIHLHVACPGRVCHAFNSSRTASCHPPSSPERQQRRGLSGNARKAFMNEAERLARSERQPPAAEQQGKRRRAFD